MHNMRMKLLGIRLKHLRGRHDQRDHNRWPAGYQAQTYTPTGRRGSAMAARATGGLAGVTQENVLANIMDSPDMIARKYGVSSQFSSKASIILNPLDENSHSSDTSNYINALSGFNAPEFSVIDSVIKSVKEAYRQNGGPISSDSSENLLRIFFARRRFLPSTRISRGIEIARSRIKAPSEIGRNAEAPNYKKISDYSPSRMAMYEIEKLFNAHPDAIKMFEDFDKQFDISTWRLDGDNDDSEYAKKAEQAFQDLENNKRQLITLIAETEAVTAEYSAMYAIHSSIEDSISGLKMQLPRYESMLYSSTSSDAVKQAAQMTIDDIQKSIDTLSMYEKAFASALQSMEPVAIEYNNKINKQVARLNLLSVQFGEKLVPQSTIDFLRQHVGTSVNPDMQSGVDWMPNVEYSTAEESDLELQTRTSNHTALMRNVNELLNLLVDSRLRDSFANGPDVIEYNSGNEIGGEYMLNYDKVRVDEDYANAVTIVHEFMHHLNNPVAGNISLREKLNALTLGFFKKRYDDSKKAYEAGFRWVPDKFPDWYAGLVEMAPDPYPTQLYGPPKSLTHQELFPVEILSMGITFMLQNPVKFAKEQPDYFRFMSVILSGAWIK